MQWESRRDVPVVSSERNDTKESQKKMDDPQEGVRRNRDGQAYSCLSGTGLFSAHT